MAELLAMFTYPQFWVGAIVVNFVVTLASAYLKPHLDAQRSARSAKHRKQTVEQRERREQKVRRLAADPQRRTEARLRLLSSKVTAVATALFGTFLIMKAGASSSSAPIVGLAVGFVGLLGTTIGANNYVEAIQEEMICDDAEGFELRQRASEGETRGRGDPEPEASGPS